MTREEKKAYQRAWYAKNPGKRAAYALAYRLKHPATKKARDEDYYRRKKAEVKARNSAWRLANPEKRREYTRDWMKRHPEKARIYRLRHKHNLTIEQWDAMWAECGGRCMICRDVLDFSKPRHPNVDHCHDTGKIRDLLCNLCNQGLGQFRDRPELLLLAVAYLAKHGKVATSPCPASAFPDGITAESTAY